MGISAIHSPSTLFHIAQLGTGLDVWVPDNDILEPNRLDLHASLRPGYFVLLRPVLVDGVCEFKYIDNRPLLGESRGAGLRLVCVIKLRESVYVKRLGWCANVGVQQRLER